MNKFIAVIAIVMMVGVSSYVLAQTVETKPVESKPADTPATAPAVTPATTTAATAPAATPATVTPPAVKPASPPAAAADVNTMVNGNTIISRDGSVIVLPHRGGCERHETGSIELNFQYAEDDISNLGKEIDAKVTNVKAEATKAGATAEAADMNYNVNTGRNVGYNPDGNDNGKYHINGNVHFNVTPADKAVVMLQALSAGKDHVSLNYRMNGGACGMQ